jgi:hypothetical protein
MEWTLGAPGWDESRESHFGGSRLGQPRRTRRTAPRARSPVDGVGLIATGMFSWSDFAVWKKIALGRRRLSERKAASRALRDSTWDIVLGMFFSIWSCTSPFILSKAATLFKAGHKSVDSAGQQLKPFDRLAGKAAGLLFILGVISTAGADRQWSQTGTIPVREWQGSTHSVTMLDERRPESRTMTSGALLSARRGAAGRSHSAASVG